MNLPQAEFLDLYKAGLKSAVELMKASLESAERLQQQQLSAIRPQPELGGRAPAGVGGRHPDRASPGMAPAWPRLVPRAAGGVIAAAPRAPRRPRAA